MGKFRVFVTSNEYSAAGLNVLREKCDVIVSKYSGFGKEIDETRRDYVKQVKGADAIVWLTKINLDKEILDAAGPQLKIVGAASAGVDQINIEELKKRGIKLTNTPGVLNAAVANVAIGLIIATTRRFKDGFRDIALGHWNIGPESFGVDIEGSTVGIIGFGGIGQEIVKKLKVFDVGRFIYTGHKEKPEGKTFNASFVSHDTLLRESDIVVLACPLTSETRNMMNAEAFEKMKSTSIVINISRGGVVDQDALVEALKTGQIWAAGLDVTVPEPLPKGHPLVSLPNCTILPHIGSATVKTRNGMAELAAENIILCLQNKPLLTPVF